MIPPYYVPSETHFHFGLNLCSYPHDLLPQLLIGKVCVPRAVLVLGERVVDIDADVAVVPLVAGHASAEEAVTLAAALHQTGPIAHLSGKHN